MACDGSPLTSASLLARAAELYDAPDSPLPAASARAARRGFASGAEWMRLALAHVRGYSVEPAAPPCGRRYQMLGLAKYALAGAAAFAWAAVALRLGAPLLAAFAIPLFYAIEAQSVFLFPLALDGHDRPFREARRWTVRAGGTWRVMAVVLPIAATMLAGGFAGRGFRRSWCLGCLAVCLWYEGLRRAT